MSAKARELSLKGAAAGRMVVFHNLLAVVINRLFACDVDVITFTLFAANWATVIRL